MRKHKLNIFPEMKEEDYTLLLDDIKSNGFDVSQPVILYNGEILDGWNRYRACSELDINPSYDNFKGDENEAFAFVLRTNKRRNLTSSQWSAIAAEADDIWELIEEKVEKEKLRKQKENASNRYTEKVASVKKFTQAKPERTSERVAKIFNTNHSYVSVAKKYKKENTEVFEQIKSGEKTIPDIKKDEKKQELIQKKEEYQERVSEKSEESISIDIFNTDNKYRVIYADPAWSYNDKQDTNVLGGAQKHYLTMTTSQICELPINTISEKDAVLFLWVTSPLLEDGLRVINEWGFKYKSSFIWDKVGHNMGHYNSVRHEFLLIATRGSCTPDKKQLFDSVQSIEKTNKHSQKPKEFMDIIDTLYTHGERIELFAREAHSKAWSVWGNEL